MLTPEQVTGLQLAFEHITDPITQFLIEDIARRLKETGSFTSTAAYEAFKLQFLGKGMPWIEEQLAALMGVAADEAAKLLEQAAEFGYINDVAKLGGAVAFKDNGSLQQIVMAATALARSDLTNITQTIGFIGKDGVSRTLTDAYINATDFAFNQIMTGALDYNTAIRKACGKLATHGIRTIDYKSGVHTSLEAAVRRNMMGGAGLMVEQISQHNYNELGADGWEITAHANSAPDHEPIQGKQYTNEQFQRLNNSLVRRIGTLNCGHNAMPIILGVSEPVYTDRELKKFRAENNKPITYNGRKFKSTYEATQYQRQIERSIRMWERREMTGAYKDAGIRLKLLRQEYNRFSKAVGLRTEEERLFVAGGGR